MYLFTLPQLILPEANWEHSPLLLVAVAPTPSPGTLNWKCPRLRARVKQVWNMFGRLLVQMRLLKALLNDRGQCLSQGTLDFLFICLRHVCAQESSNSWYWMPVKNLLKKVRLMNKGFCKMGLRMKRFLKYWWNLICQMGNINYFCCWLKQKIQKNEIIHRRSLLLPSWHNQIIQMNTCTNSINLANSLFNTQYLTISNNKYNFLLLKLK